MPLFSRVACPAPDGQSCEQHSPGAGQFPGPATWEPSRCWCPGKGPCGLDAAIASTATARPCQQLPRPAELCSRGAAAWGSMTGANTEPGPCRVLQAHVGSNSLQCLPLEAFWVKLQCRGPVWHCCFLWSYLLGFSHAAHEYQYYLEVLGKPVVVFLQQLRQLWCSRRASPFHRMCRSVRGSTLNTSKLSWGTCK